MADPCAFDNPRLSLSRFLSTFLSTIPDSETCGLEQPNDDKCSSQASTKSSQINGATEYLKNSTTVMYCQSCRAPLKVDSSLEELSPAAFDLLVSMAHSNRLGTDLDTEIWSVDSTGKSLRERTRSQASAQAGASYPQERKELYDRVQRGPDGRPQSPVFKGSIPAPNQRQNEGKTDGGSTSPTKRTTKKDMMQQGMSFVMLTDSQYGGTPAEASGRKSEETRKERGSSKSPGPELSQQDLSQQIETTARLFEILSARSDIDHPICTECTEILREGLQTRLTSTMRERDAYVDFLRRMNADVPTAQEKEEAEADLTAAQKAEAAAFKELEELEREKDVVDEEIAALEDEAHELDIEEETFWQDRNAFAQTLTEFQNERDAVNMQYDHDSKQLERLQRTNVYNDTFCIGHDGWFGTINGLRLGRVAGQNVEWAEINAAWGQALLLLATVADKLGYTFDGYRLRPLGSTSKIDKLEYASQGSGSGSVPGQAPNAAPKMTVLELYASSDFALGRMFIHRRFDSAMVAFLDCLKQLGDFVARPHPPSSHGDTSRGIKLPYEISKDRIGDASIKLGFNQDETWTKACKYTLTCCKFLLAHASNMASRSGV